ncbi:DUF362 domain-containing protein [Chloroflexota bacterium]
MNEKDSITTQKEEVSGNKAKVSIVKAGNYNLSELHPAIEKCIELIGGFKQVVAPGSKVFVKINHLSPPSPPERGIVTHPAFVEAILTLLKEITSDITVGDDIESGFGDGFCVSGFRQMCERVGVKLINLRETGFLETVCNGYLLETIHLAKTALEADVIINLPKLKTHSFCFFTGGVKNMYGTIPTGLRRKFHAVYHKNELFSQMLVDLFFAVRPAITIMDSVVAMEGEGPAGGNPRYLGLILASKDTVALDAVAAKITGFHHQDISTTRYAAARGLGIADLNNIEVAGENISDVAVTDFKPPSSAVNTITNNIPQFLPKFVIGQLSVKPEVKTEFCTACGECEKICPAGAMTIPEGKAQVDYGKCIQCMCCHEVCRFNAIVPKQTITANIIKQIGRFLKNARGNGE